VDFCEFFPIFKGSSFSEFAVNAVSRNLSAYRKVFKILNLYHSWTH
jgi:hypothetical protein